MSATGADPRPRVEYHERGGHISGWYDTQPRVFAAYVRRVIRGGGWTWVTTTETYGRSLHYLRVAMPGWRWWRQGEYVIGVKRSQFRGTPRRFYRRFSTVYTGRDDWRNVKAHGHAVIHRATGTTFYLVAAHPPAAVDAGQGRVKPGPAWDAWHEGLDALGEWAAQQRREDDGLVVSIGIDTNRNLHDHGSRADVRRHLQMPTCWDGQAQRRPKPGVGTHAGGRLIDAVVSNGDMRDPGLSKVRRPPRVDHVAVGVTQVFRAAA